MQKIEAICWFRRDLRLDDHKALSAALSQNSSVSPIFIWDSKILETLAYDQQHPRVSFIFNQLQNLRNFLKEKNKNFYVFYGDPEQIFQVLHQKYQYDHLYFNQDYEPFALKRDEKIVNFCKKNQIQVHTFCDHLLLPPFSVEKKDGTPYQIYTPFARAFQVKLQPKDWENPYPIHLNHLAVLENDSLYTLENLGFSSTILTFPPLKIDENLLKNYEQTRNFAAIEGTSKLSVHLRFGTLSIRALFREAKKVNATVFINELIWREFFAMILYRFPQVVHRSFKSKYDQIIWRNDEKEFELWCQGRTGFPLIDAAMHQLNTTGWMHNRLRMLVASFLTKNLLIDWRWGEAYFAKKLIDYDLSANNGGWQWAAGTGADAAPYFRIFNPLEQAKKFDPQGEFVQKYLPKSSQNLTPMVDLSFSRQRALVVYKQALG